MNLHVRTGQEAQPAAHFASTPDLYLAWPQGRAAPHPSVAAEAVAPRDERHLEEMVAAAAALQQRLALGVHACVHVCMRVHRVLTV